VSTNLALEGLTQAVREQNSLLAEVISLVTSQATAGTAPVKLEPLIPLQRTPSRGVDKKRVPGEIATVTRNRTWALLLKTEGKSSKTASDLVISLLAEGYSYVTPRDVAGWLTRWERLGRIRCVTAVPAPSYELVDGGKDRRVMDRRLLTPSEDDPVPILLRSAFDEVVESGKDGLQARTLAAAAGIQSYRYGAHLSDLMRHVGVVRPAHRKLREVPGGPLAPGYTEECLGRAVAAYEAAASDTSRFEERTASC